MHHERFHEYKTPLAPWSQNIAITRYALPESVHIPIATKSEEDITRYVSTIENIIAPGQPNQALLVSPCRACPKDTLPIWTLPANAVLYYPTLPGYGNMLITPGIAGPTSTPWGNLIMATMC